MKLRATLSSLVQLLMLHHVTTCSGVWVDVYVWWEEQKGGSTCVYHAMSVWARGQQKGGSHTIGTMLVHADAPRTFPTS